MIRVHVICEGQTEASVVGRVLTTHFHSLDIALMPAVLGKPGRKGGDVRYERLRHDVRLRLLGDATAFCTTLIDFYGLPASFPGKADAQSRNQHTSKSECVTSAMVGRLTEEIGPTPMRRFIPYLQMHEFEGLLFSDPASIAQATYRPEIADKLAAVRERFATPEEINDGPRTAPSKRIAELCPDYEKVLHGTLAASRIGLATLRRECPLLNAWISRLEALANPPRRPVTG